MVWPCQAADMIDDIEFAACMLRAIHNLGRSDTKTRDARTKDRSGDDLSLNDDTSSNQASTTSPPPTLPVPFTSLLETLSRETLQAQAARDNCGVHGRGRNSPASARKLQPGCVGLASTSSQIRARARVQGRRKSPTCVDAAWPTPPRLCRTGRARTCCCV